jgi:hypothetical protein
MAWFGAFVLVLLAAMSVVSIAGRALSGLGLGPVPGDFELVEAGTALAVFCFLPWATSSAATPSSTCSGAPTRRRCAACSTCWPTR